MKKQTFIALMLSAVVLAGCGGGDSPSEPNSALGNSDENIAFTARAMTQDSSDDSPDTYTVLSTMATLTGIAKRGSKVVVATEGVVMGTTTVDASGNWSYALPEQSVGTHSYSVFGQNTMGRYQTEIVNLRNL
jgi:hypothetical protein